MRIQWFRALVILPVVTALQLACGEGDNKRRSAAPVAGTESRVGSDDQAVSFEPQCPATGLTTIKPVQKLWVNFDGAQVSKGEGPDQAFMMCQSSATIPASFLSGDEQNMVLELVRSAYSRAGVRIVVQRDEPIQHPFTTIHVGGFFSDIGCTGNPIGIAPSDENNVFPSDVGFVFSGLLENDPSPIEAVSVGIAHESAHSFGLMHVKDEGDIMKPVHDGRVIGFGQGSVDPGPGTQDGPGVLIRNLGGLSGNEKTDEPEFHIKLEQLLKGIGTQTDQQPSKAQVNGEGVCWR